MPDISAGAIQSTDPARGLLAALDWGSALPETTPGKTVVKVHFAAAETRYKTYYSEAFTDYEKERFEAAFDRIEAVSRLRFETTDRVQDADFQLLVDAEQVIGTSLGLFNPPDTADAGIGVFNGSAWARSAGGDLEAGGAGFVTITHEVLHGLGMAHAHDSGGTSTVMAGVRRGYGDFGAFGLNQGLFTTMSYNSGWAANIAGSGPDAEGLWGREAGPMALDIAVLQRKYGANTETAAGDDIYVLPFDNRSGTSWQSLWDVGGYDEIRAPDDQPVTIDLRPASLISETGGGGFVSWVAGVAGGYTLAADVVIEAARGGGGDDVLIGNDADNLLRGGGGADRMAGGLGNDFYYVDSAEDVIEGEIAYAQGGGIDTVRAFVDYIQPKNIELVRLGYVADALALNATGNDAPGTLVGNAGDNVLIGRGGDDQLNGNGGDDVMTGNTGRDTLVGGAGRDIFVYTAYADSRAGALARDMINGFDRGADRIDLSELDANTGLAGIQAFEFIGVAAFSQAGQLRLVGLGGPNAILVEADHNGDGGADLQILVNLTTVLGAQDFIL